ncbi:MAG: hypothetical protein IH867_08610 [Chloroflexi bacterium]|nr:hypothetical protein [Chloroflexota bacterium]
MRSVANPVSFAIPWAGSAVVLLAAAFADFSMWAALVVFAALWGYSFLLVKIPLSPTIPKYQNLVVGHGSIEMITGRSLGQVLLTVRSEMLGVGKYSVSREVSGNLMVGDRIGFVFLRGTVELLKVEPLRGDPQAVADDEAGSDA